MTHIYYTRGYAVDQQYFHFMEGKYLERILCGGGKRRSLWDHENRLENTDLRREGVAETITLGVRKSQQKSAVSLTLCVNLDHSPSPSRFQAFFQCKMNVRLNDMLGFLQR